MKHECFGKPFIDEQDEASRSGRVRPPVKLDRAITSLSSASVTLQKDRRPKQSSLDLKTPDLKTEGSE